VSGHDNGIIGTTAMRMDEKTCIDSIHFDPSVVLKAIGKIKPNVASGPENFPPLLLAWLGDCR